MDTDISDQKEGSMFLSARKIGEKNAKKLRYRDSNPRNKRYQVNKYKDQNTLFNMDKFLRLTDEQKN